MTKIDTSTEAIAALIKAHDEDRPHDCKGFTALELAARELVPALTAENADLRAEVELMRADLKMARLEVQHAVDHANAAIEEVERLRATPPEVTAMVDALRPFAEAAMHLHPATPSEATTLDGIEVGQWRAAYAALAAWEAANG